MSSSGKLPDFDEHRKELEKFKWMNQKKKPDFEKNTHAGSDQLNYIKIRLRLVLQKEARIVRDQQHDILYRAKGTMDERLSILNEKEPSWLEPHTDKLVDIEYRHDCKIFELERKFASFGYKKPKEYYLEALNQKSDFHNELIQASYKQEADIHEFVMNYTLLGFYHVCRDLHLSSLERRMRESRIEKKELRDYITASIENSFEGGPSSGGRVRSEPSVAGSSKTEKGITEQPKSTTNKNSSENLEAKMYDDFNLEEQWKIYNTLNSSMLLNSENYLVLTEELLHIDEVPFSYFFC